MSLIILFSLIYRFENDTTNLHLFTTIFHDTSLYRVKKFTKIVTCLKISVISAQNMTCQKKNFLFIFYNCNNFFFTTNFHDMSLYREKYFTQNSDMSKDFSYLISKYDMSKKGNFFCLKNCSNIFFSLQNIQITCH